MHVIQTDTQVGGEVELTRHVPHDTLEEGVDGLNAEVVVFVEEVEEADTRPFTDDLRVETCLLLDDSQIVVRVWQLFPDTVKLTEDTHLHLLGGLIGEGDGEDRAVAHRVLYQQGDIFGGECEGLSAAGTRFIYGQGSYHRLKISKSN